METFKQAMAFLLYGTVAFLVYVLTGHLANDYVVLSGPGGLGLVVQALWVHAPFTQGGASGRRRAIGYVFSALALGTGLAWGYPSAAPSEWQEWRPGLAEELRDVDEGDPSIISAALSIAIGVDRVRANHPARLGRGRLRSLLDQRERSGRVAAN